MNPAPVKPDVGSEGIHTGDPLLSPCPGWGGPLNGRKTVCSPRCRTRRWRQHQEQRTGRIKALVRAGPTAFEEVAP